MKLGWLLLLFIALRVADANAEDTVALGRVISHKYMDVELDCPKDYICMDVWYRWIISIDRTLSGPPVKGRVVAAHLQHTDLNKRFERSLRLFVLRPLSDPARRDELKADYHLLEVSPENEMYCIQHDPSTYGLAVENTYVRVQDDYKQYCFEIPTPEQ